MRRSHASWFRTTSHLPDNWWVSHSTRQKHTVCYSMNSISARPGVSRLTPNRRCTLLFVVCLRNKPSKVASTIGETRSVHCQTWVVPGQGYPINDRLPDGSRREVENLTVTQRATHRRSIACTTHTAVVLACSPLACMTAESHCLHCILVPAGYL
jgi:hypothetical protein